MNLLFCEPHVEIICRGPYPGEGRLVAFWITDELGAIPLVKFEPYTDPVSISSAVLEIVQTNVHDVDYDYPQNREDWKRHLVFLYSRAIETEDQSAYKHFYDTVDLFNQWHANRQRLCGMKQIVSYSPDRVIEMVKHWLSE